MLLSHYMEEEYLDLMIETLENLNNNTYYTEMAAAWLICEIYTKYPQETTKYLKKNKLNNFTQNKSISKIHDSSRVSKEEKEYLNTLKRK